MIGWLAGTVRAVGADTAVVEAGGVGYELMVPSRALAHLRAGEAVQLWVHTHVREDVLALYGFPGERDRAAFRALLGVNGVGPKVALGVLGAVDVEALRHAIESGDLKTLTKLPGVGRRLAERLCVELRDKTERLFGGAGAFAGAGGPGAGGAAGAGDGGGAAGGGADPDARDAVRALVGLGFREHVAERAVLGARERLGAADFEALLREALREARGKS
ncbi:MAG TPA: Holliday junction branch migration protein RuvA [Myxococcota bacterium]|nr:Holliday junction branch migration protein RuvA [Myxococcota bacterium]